MSSGLGRTLRLGRQVNYFHGFSLLELFLKSLFQLTAQKEQALAVLFLAGLLSDLSPRAQVATFRFRI